MQKQRQYFKSSGKSMPKSKNGITASVPKRLRKGKATHGKVTPARRQVKGLGKITSKKSEIEFTP